MAQRALFDKNTLNNLRKYPLYSQDGKGDDAIVSAKIFNPYGGQKFFITEWDGNDTFYGYSSQTGRHDDPSNEYGYFSKKDLENIRVNVYGVKLPLERDISYSTPKRMGEVMENELGRPKQSTKVQSAFGSSSNTNKPTPQGYVAG